MVLDFLVLNTRIFPGDLIGVILLRLPVKTLKRFECVSKVWKILFSDPNFIKNHLRNMTVHDYQDFVVKTNSEACIIRIRDDDIGGFHAIKLNSTPEAPAKILDILGHCNGLVCMRVLRREPSFFSLMLWNPATGKHNELPGPYMDSSAVFGIGFGYDSSIDTYKVVRVSYDQHWRRILEYCNIEVLSLKTNSWKRVITDVPYGLNKQQSVSANGFVYWFALKDSAALGYLTVILCFDIVKERIEELPSPATVELEVTICGLRLLGGSLCVLGYGDVGYVDVWVLKENEVSKSWNKLFKFPHEPEFLKCRSFFPICVLGNGRVLMIADHKHFYLNDHIESLQQVAVPGNLFCTTATPYVESLVSPYRSIFSKFSSI